MFNVDLNSNGNDRSKDNPLMLDEEEDQHDVFEFPTNKFPSKGFHFQDCYIMLAFGNDYHSIMGIQTPLHHPTMYHNRWIS